MTCAAGGGQALVWACPHHTCNALSSPCSTRDLLLMLSQPLRGGAGTDSRPQVAADRRRALSGSPAGFQGLLRFLGRPATLPTGTPGSPRAGISAHLEPE